MKERYAETSRHIDRAAESWIKTRNRRETDNTDGQSKFRQETDLRKNKRLKERKKEKRKKEM